MNLVKFRGNAIGKLYIVGEAFIILVPQSYPAATLSTHIIFLLSWNPFSASRSFPYETIVFTREIKKFLVFPPHFNSLNFISFDRRVLNTEFHVGDVLQKAVVFFHAIQHFIEMVTVLLLFIAPHFCEICVTCRMQHMNLSVNF